MSHPNLFTSEFDYDSSDPDGYRAGYVPIGKAAGGEELAVKLFEIPPGQSLCPYHYEYVEEWLLVLDGDLVLRVPDGEEQVARGDVVSFPAGPEGAHKLTNRGEARARIVMFSSAREPAVAVYPDSDKILASTGNQADRVMLRRADGHVDYYEGEV
ncbi:MAG TPA: cupin domain-containing protein [Solirubrobacteraceae bacterium]|jgi:uncharacterized cupin superfamily protein